MWWLRCFNSTIEEELVCTSCIRSETRTRWEGGRERYGGLAGELLTSGGFKRLRTPTTLSRSLKVVPPLSHKSIESGTHPPLHTPESRHPSPLATATVEQPRDNFAGLMKEPMACSYFPEDVMTEILKRLPVKFLHQFQCVSKSWLTLIRSPNFVREHRMSSSESILVSDGRHFSHFFGDYLESMERLDYFPLDFGIFLYGCCDGIVCAAVHVCLYSETHFLWNPATREYKNLPASCIPESQSDGAVYYVVGFGFDPKNNDYKVVRMVRYDWTDLVSSMRRYSWRVEVYSMRSNSWREIQPLETYPVARHPFNPDNCVDGVLFWVGYKSNDDDRKSSFILLFDMGEEEFKVIDMPPSVDSNGLKFNQSFIAVFDVLTGGRIDMWVMDVEFKNIGTSSWAKQYTILYPCPNSYFSPLGFTSSGELLGYADGDQLLSYCHTDYRVKSLCEGNVPSIEQFVCYRESLAPLGGGNVLQMDPIDMEYCREFYGVIDDADEFSSDEFSSGESDGDVEM